MKPEARYPQIQINVENGELTISRWTSGTGCDFWLSEKITDKMMIVVNASEATDDECIIGPDVDIFS